MFLFTTSGSTFRHFNTFQSNAGCTLTGSTFTGSTLTGSTFTGSLGRTCYSDTLHQVCHLWRPLPKGPSTRSCLGGGDRDVAVSEITFFAPAITNIA